VAPLLRNQWHGQTEIATQKVKFFKISKKGKVIIKYWQVDLRVDKSITMHPNEENVSVMYRRKPKNSC